MQTAHSQTHVFGYVLFAFIIFYILIYFMQDGSQLVSLWKTFSMVIPCASFFVS